MFEELKRLEKKNVSLYIFCKHIISGKMEAIFV